MGSMAGRANALCLPTGWLLLCVTAAAGDCPIWHYAFVTEKGGAER